MGWRDGCLPSAKACSKSVLNCLDRARNCLQSQRVFWFYSMRIWSRVLHTLCWAISRMDTLAIGSEMIERVSLRPKFGEQSLKVSSGGEVTPNHSLNRTHCGMRLKALHIHYWAFSHIPQRSG